jgi:hypothetical protein
MNDSEEDEDDVCTARTAVGENLGAAEDAAVGEQHTVDGDQLDGSEQEVAEVEEQEVPAKRMLPQRMRVPSKRMKDAYMLMLEAGSITDEPETLDRALKQPDGELWQQAADEEMQSLKRLGVYQVVDNNNYNLLKNKWVLKRKRTKEGLIERYKARLVVKGFAQTKGVDYDEVYAPVARHVTLRALLAVAAVKDYEIQQIDVKTAFLNGPLREDIYMEPPAGYDFGEGKVLKLNKALYGLKQAARAWNQELVKVLAKHGFEVSQADVSLFTLKRCGRQVWLLIYVDDGLIVGIKEDVEVVINIMEVFDIRRLGDATFFLGMEIVRDRQMHTLCLTQVKYAKTILEKTGMSECKTKSTPMQVNTRLSKYGKDTMADSGVYAEVVGMLLYLSTCTRPDLAFSVGMLARFMSQPRQEHWTQVKGVLQYLRKTAGRGIMFGGAELKLEAYCDSDFAADPDKRRSTGGYVVLLGGGAFSWASKLLPTVGASTMEVEYMAAAWLTKELLWERKLMATLTCAEETQAVELRCDNQGAIALMRNPTNHQRAKHIDVCHHFVRERVARGEIKVEYCPSKDMLADMFTKALPKPQHEEHSKRIGLVDVD